MLLGLARILGATAIAALPLAAFAAVAKHLPDDFLESRVGEWSTGVLLLISIVSGIALVYLLRPTWLYALLSFMNP